VAASIFLHTIAMPGPMPGIGVSESPPKTPRPPAGELPEAASLTPFTLARCEKRRGSSTQLSPSCAGLTRASIMNRRGKKLTKCWLLPNLLMDCRVKPGNDKTNAKLRD
jgi:hypothetical protein